MTKTILKNTIDSIPELVSLFEDLLNNQGDFDPDGFLNSLTDDQLTYLFYDLSHQYMPEEIVDLFPTTICSTVNFFNEFFGILKTNYGVPFQKNTLYSRDNQLDIVIYSFYNPFTDNIETIIINYGFDQIHYNLNNTQTVYPTYE